MSFRKASPMKAKGLRGGLVLAAALTALAEGCNAPHRETRVQQAMAITEGQAVNIALSEVKGIWPSAALKAGGAAFNGAYWSVDVWRLPPVLGGFVVVQISKDGRVLRRISGY